MGSLAHRLPKVKAGSGFALAAGVPLNFDSFIAGISGLASGGGGTTALMQILSEMQSEPTNDATLCIDSFKSTGVKFDTLIKDMTDDTSYKAGRALKEMELDLWLASTCQT